MAEKILHVIYRISDKGNPKVKLPNADKWSCLTNAVQEFGAENFHVIADNCTAETIDALKSTGLSLETTANGCAGTYKYTFKKVVECYAPDDNLYLLEDDYLHLPGSREALLEGLEIADYVTLYDHPDMYHPDGKGPNPFVHDDLPKASIYLTAHTHWRSTVSTTMTFAVKAKTLAEDLEIWEHFFSDSFYYKIGDSFVGSDFATFLTLTGQDDMEDAKYFYEIGKTGLATLVFKNFLSKRKKRLLISPMPSFATHTEINFLAPLIDWTKV